MKTPDLKPKSMTLQLDYVNKLLGMDFDRGDVKGLLERMRYGADFDGGGNEIRVLIPPYRTDVLHPIDLVEDIAIAYGYGNFKPEMPKIGTSGRKDPMEKFMDDVRELMLGFGFQEVMTLIMTCRADLFSRMQIPEEEVLEAKNPVSLDHSVARTWLLPSLLTVLGRNKNREYPQRIFEVGECITAKGRDGRRIAAVVAHSKANFSEVKAVVTGLLDDLTPGYKIKPHIHNSFIEGRSASIKSGFFGEIHPLVLENFGLEVPVCGVELDLDLIYGRGGGK
jgi:phenylalanyl-tRNA synthetase beta chain